MPETGAEILVIDDEPEIRKLLKVALSANGYKVTLAETGGKGLARVSMLKPDVVILDLGLPDIDGIEVLRSLREQSNVPVIILSVKGQEGDKVKALDLGADDYVTKPFNMGELLARIRVTLRHFAKSDEPVLSIGELRIDIEARSVTFAGKPVKLTRTEYDLLKMLAVNAGKVLTHKQVLREIWDIEDPKNNQYLRVYIRQLRRKIESDPSRPRYIITEPGVGYRLCNGD